MSKGISYTLDQTNTIIATNLSFDNFAVSNNAEELSKTVVGQSIWKYISYGEVQRLYHRLFDAIRSTGKEVVLNFRCDSHQVLRFMKMFIEPEEDNHLKVTTKLIREVDRKVLLSKEILYLGVNSGTSMCSKCNRIYISVKGQWMEIDQAIEEGYIGDELSVSFKICECCTTDIQKAITELQETSDQDQ